MWGLCLSSCWATVSRAGPCSPGHGGASHLHSALSPCPGAGHLRAARPRPARRRSPAPTAGSPLPRLSARPALQDGAGTSARLPLGPGTLSSLRLPAPGRADSSPRPGSIPHRKPPVALELEPSPEPAPPLCSRPRPSEKAAGPQSAPGHRAPAAAPSCLLWREPFPSANISSSSAHPRLILGSSLASL